VAIRGNWLSRTCTISTKAFKIVCQTINIFGQVELSALFRSLPICGEPIIVNRQAAAVYCIHGIELQVTRIFVSLLHFLFIKNYTSDQIIIISIIIAQFVYLILMTYCRREHHVDQIRCLVSRDIPRLVSQMLIKRQNLCLVSTIPLPFCRSRFAVAVPTCCCAVTTVP